MRCCRAACSWRAAGAFAAPAAGAGAFAAATPAIRRRFARCTASAFQPYQAAQAPNIRAMKIQRTPAPANGSLPSKASSGASNQNTSDRKATPMKARTGRLNNQENRRFMHIRRSGP
jgi:hypothetical protein